jgi:hypothetical protein
LGTGKKIALGVIIGVGVIFGLVFAIYIYASETLHDECVEWRERIEDRRVEIESDLLSSINPRLQEALNNEIRQWNAECGEK